ncbi:hypothetical protein [Streptomyces salinarius]|uniref:hypothetical protein n=1 Tax=Streptomyces salinarius TaxID=2762598 RepID=UPI0021BD8974|nr:hypothetical protein [Streptomyces salinarius]
MQHAPAARPSLTPTRPSPPTTTTGAHASLAPAAPEPPPATTPARASLAPATATRASLTPATPRSSPATTAHPSPAATATAPTSLAPATTRPSPTITTRPSHTPDPATTRPWPATSATGAWPAITTSCPSPDHATRPSPDAATTGPSPTAGAHPSPDRAATTTARPSPTTSATGAAPATTGPSPTTTARPTPPTTVRTAPAPTSRPLRCAVLSAALVLAVSACGAGGGREAEPPVGTGSASSQSPATLPSPALPPVLTRGQARAALITAADLGEAWEPTRGAATWRDEVLKTTAERTGRPDCRRLLDVLYTEDLFGGSATTAPRATVALDDPDGGAQLHYRITSYRAADIDATLAWLATLPDACGHFEARDEAARGAARDVRVTALTLPGAGDARGGLRVTVSDARTEEALTVDLVAVRVGDDALSLTNGTLDTPADDATRTAVEVGTERLTEARRQGRAQV